jgi:hypothetical protein
MKMIHGDGVGGKEKLGAAAPVFSFKFSVFSGEKEAPTVQAPTSREIPSFKHQRQAL